MSMCVQSLQNRIGRHIFKNSNTADNRASVPDLRLEESLFFGCAHGCLVHTLMIRNFLTQTSAMDPIVAMHIWKNGVILRFALSRAKCRSPYASERLSVLHVVIIKGVCFSCVLY